MPAKLKSDDDAATALGEALQTDKARGARQVAAESLGELNSPAAAKQLLTALNDEKEAEVRATIVQALGSLKENAEIAAKLETIANDDPSPIPYFKN